MLARRFGNYLLAKDMHASAAALIFGVLAFFGIPTGFMSVVILALVTLAKGARPGLMVLAWAALPALCLLYINHWDSLDLLSLSRFVLIWGFALLLRSKASWQRLLELEMLLGAAGVIIFHLFVPKVAEWWVSLLTGYFDKLELNHALKLTPDQLKQFIAQVAPYATGSVAVGILLGVLLLLVMARFWQQSLILTKGSFGAEFCSIRLSHWDAGVLFAAVLGCLLQKTMALDLLPVVIFPFVVGGISLLHYGINRKKPETLMGGALVNKVLIFVLAACYIGLLFVPWAAALLLAFLGLVDSGYNIRKQIFDRKKVRA